MYTLSCYRDLLHNNYNYLVVIADNYIYIFMRMAFCQTS